MLHIRNDAFHQLGDDDLADMQVQGKSPTSPSTQTQNLTPADNANIGRIVRARSRSRAT